MANNPDGRAFAQLLDGTPLRVLVSADFATIAWRKLLINAVENPITALTLQRQAVLRRDDIYALCLAILGEAVAVARADGARLPDEEPTRTMATLLSYPPEAGTSMYFDRLAGRSLEVEALTGTDQNTKDILEAVNFIKEKVEQLPTKEDVRAIVEQVVDEKLQPIHASLTEINRRLDTIEEHYANLKGVTKEIDEIRGEVRAIQKHLGTKGRSRPDHARARRADSVQFTHSVESNSGSAGPSAGHAYGKPTPVLLPPYRGFAVRFSEGCG